MKSANELIGPLALFENHLPTLPFFTPFSHLEVKEDDHGHRPPGLEKVRARGQRRRGWPWPPPSFLNKVRAGGHGQPTYTLVRGKG